MTQPTTQYTAISELNLRPLATERPFSLLDLWRIFVIRRATIGWITAASVVLALAVSLCMTRKYAAQSEIEINAENPAALELTNSPSAAEQGEYAVDLATQASVLQSDTLALQVMQQLKLDARDRARFTLFRSPDDLLPLEQSAEKRTRLLKRFHRNLSVHVVGGTRLIEVRYTDRDPATAAAAVNTLIGDYLEQYFQTRYSATHQASDWLSKQLADLKNDVEVSQQRLADYQKQTGILGESETNNVVMAKLEELNRQLSAAEANRIVKQAVWQLAKTGDPELISSVAGTSFMQGVGSAANPSQLGLLPGLRAQEAQLKSEIAQTSARLGPSFPKLVQMKSQLADLQHSIDLEIGKIAARAENDFVAANNAEAMERALFERQKQEANQLNDSAIQYGILKREVDANRDLYQGMLGKFKQAGVLAGLRSSNIVVVDPARPGAKPSSPDYPLNLLLGALAGLIAGAGFTLLQDAMDRSIHTPEDVRRLTGLRSLAVVPRLPQVSKRQKTAEIAERFGSLRTALLLSNLDAPPKVIVVTSALPREGKTTVSVNLARSFAQQGSRVLLVDGDMRCPSVHRELGADNAKPGLSALLQSSGDQSATVPDLREGLHVLCSGTRPPLPSETLASPRMATIIAAWREQYDYIVIDTPPVLTVTDPVVLSRFADSVLLVVRAESTTNDALLRTHEILEQCHAPLLGTVLNAMNFASAQYAHYFGHSYRAKETQEYYPS
jgi:polysaccharide biosynthesis transport protein